MVLPMLRGVIAWDVRIFRRVGVGSHGRYSLKDGSMSLSSACEARRLAAGLGNVTADH